MKIAIVNDMFMAVEALRRVLISVPEYQIAWIARDGAQAVAQAAKDTPDLILMDLLMPVMDGVEATRHIMKSSPCAILVVTSSVTENTSKVFEAMGAGALDAVSTPVLGARGKPGAAQTLLAKIATIGKLIEKPLQSRQSPIHHPKSHLPPLVVIGSSTGGPKALATILADLPQNFGGAIVIIQHVDYQFAQGLVEWLALQTTLKVQLAQADSCPEPGKVLFAGGKDHLVLQKNLTLTYTQEPRDSLYRPSVDAFFKSVVKYWPQPGIALLLTGMGRDGAEGLSLLRFKGWYTIAQNQETCVVYGMPKAAIALGAAAKILPLQAIASSLIKQINI